MRENPIIEWYMSETLLVGIPDVLEGRVVPMRTHLVIYSELNVI